VGQISGTASNPSRLAFKDGIVFSERQNKADFGLALALVIRAKPVQDAARTIIKTPLPRSPTQLKIGIQLYITKQKHSSEMGFATSWAILVSPSACTNCFSSSVMLHATAPSIAVA